MHTDPCIRKGENNVSDLLSVDYIHNATRKLLKGLEQGQQTQQLHETSKMQFLYQSMFVYREENMLLQTWAEHGVPRRWDLIGGWALKHGDLHHKTQLECSQHSAN